MGLSPATNRQVPDHAILDFYNKQNYLGNQWVYTASFTAGATSETNWLLLSNPSVTTSAFPSNNLGLFCNILKLTVLTASQSAIMRVYLNPTVSAGGTPVMQANLRPKSPNASVATVANGPTTSPNGSLIAVMSASPGISDQSLVMPILDPGQTMLITIQPTSNSTVVIPQCGWYEL